MSFVMCERSSLFFRARLVYALFALVLFGIVSVSVIKSARAGDKKIKVGFSQWPPWKIVENGQFGGIDAAILEALSRHAGIEFQFVACPWKRCVEMLKSGDIDMVTNFGKTPERQAFSIYIEPGYLRQKVCFYGLREDQNPIHFLEDLKGLKIGAIKGSVYFEAFDQSQTFERIDVLMEQQLFKMLLNHRIDLLIGYKIPTEYLMTIEGIEEKLTKKAYHSDGYMSYFALSRKSMFVDKAPLISKALEKMILSGETDKIIEDFFGRLKYSRHK